MELEKAGDVSLEDLRRIASEDTRPTLPEPPPVRLVAVGDVTLVATNGMEPKLDAFYVDLLRFVKEVDTDQLAYAAERFRLNFDLSEQPPDRESCRPLGVMVWHFGDVIDYLEKAGVDYSRVNGMIAGQDTILMQDPAGNWVAIGDQSEVR